MVVAFVKAADEMRDGTVPGTCLRAGDPFFVWLVSRLGASADFSRGFENSVRLQARPSRAQPGDGRKCMNWKGVMPAITTCFDEKLRVDHDFMAKHYLWLA